MAKPEKLMLCLNKQVNLLKTEGEFVKRKALGLFTTFFKIGAFTFGGGYAMIPLIQREIVDKKQWATNEDLLDIIAIAESTPGPIAVNAATFIGSKIDGFFGALFATLGVVLPSFITILAVSFAIAQFEHIKIVQYAFTGIRAAVLALIIRALAAMYKECPKSPLSYIIAAAAFFCCSIYKHQHDFYHTRLCCGRPCCTFGI